ncbi:Uma2 family endonuclease [Sphingomonadaceae bacterium OTU29LAMAA1]|nr:Uma2 family endonuclease [Sphingomonadaceae bacterium OTU29LAMAA1]
MATLPPGDPQRFRLHIEHYELLAAAEAFAMQRVEMIDGQVLMTRPKDRDHTRLTSELLWRLRPLLQVIAPWMDAFVGVSVALPPHDMPTPDVVVAASQIETNYWQAGDIAIVIEVANASLSTDLSVKRHLYAEHGIPEYWVVDVERRQVHQFWTPADGDYRETRIVPLAGDIHSVTLPNLTVNGAGIL